MRDISVLIAIFFVFPLAACGPYGPFDVINPQEVSVEDALRDIGNGLSAMNEINRRDGRNNGLLLDEVSVSLNVKASANQNGKLVLDTKNIAPPALSGGSIGGGAELGRESYGERSNAIVVKFKNAYTTQLNAAGQKANVVVVGPGQVELGNVGLLSVPSPPSGISPELRRMLDDLQRENR